MYNNISLFLLIFRVFKLRKTLSVLRNEGITNSGSKNYELQDTRGPSSFKQM